MLQASSEYGNDGQGRLLLTREVITMGQQDNLAELAGYVKLLHSVCVARLICVYTENTEKMTSFTVSIDEI